MLRSQTGQFWGMTGSILDEFRPVWGLFGIKGWPANHPILGDSGPKLGPPGGLFWGMGGSDPYGRYGGSYVTTANSIPLKLLHHYVCNYSYTHANLRRHLRLQTSSSSQNGDFRLGTTAFKLFMTSLQASYHLRPFRQAPHQVGSETRS